MFTDCPSCGRQFRLSAGHLSAAAGEVRCGFCGAQFNALSRLRDAPLERSAIQGKSPAANPGADEPEFDIAPGPVSVEQPATARQANRWSPSIDDGEPEDGGYPGRRRAWTAVALVLLLAGTAQIAWFQRDAVLARYPGLFTHAEWLCARIGCSVLRQRDLSAISVLNRDVRAHPRYQDALLVNATLSNTASFAQSFPLIQLALSDTSGTVIAARAFAPDEYLDDSIDRRRGMAPDAPVHVVLEIAGVGAEAVSFEIGFR